MFLVESAAITDSRMYLKIITPKITANIGINDEVQSGIMISNSELGLGSLNIKPFINRLVCLNGLVVSEMEHSMLRKYHVGKTNMIDTKG